MLLHTDSEISNKFKPKTNIIFTWSEILTEKGLNCHRVTYKAIKQTKYHTKCHLKYAIDFKLIIVIIV